MDIYLDFVEPATPAPSYNGSFWKTEDSGYHTFTPEAVEISNENLDPSAIQGKVCTTGPTHYDTTPEAKLSRKRLHSKCVLSNPFSENRTVSPINRRGIKRPFQDDSDEVCFSPVPTPTSMIAGGIQKLKVTDTSAPSHRSISFSSADSVPVTSDLYYLKEHTHTLSYPTTPVKKICRTSCKLSPLKRSAKKLNFTIHSLSCESNAVVKLRPHSKVVRTIQFRPEQKIDIIKMLYEDARVMPPIRKILNFLSNEDIYNFSLVSPLWCHVWNQVSKVKKQEYQIYLKNAIENQENQNTGLTPKNTENSQVRSLKEVHNVINMHSVKSSTRSPPGTPRTNKFKKFTKSASLDSRLQLSCVRCAQPAKVTEEASGEEWVECTSNSCSYQYCRFCKCNRHPGKNCFKYDLEGPSPSKRRKSLCVVGTKKSKKNLRRLLC